MRLNLDKITGFNWDQGNIDKNWRTHQVIPKECEEAFTNKPITFFYDKTHSQKEDRFLLYGHTNANRKLTIIFTIRNHQIRVISARDQNQKERQVYEKI